MKFTVRPGAPVSAGADSDCQKPHIYARKIYFLASSTKPSAEFSRRGRENKLKSVFSGDMCIGKNTSQPASVESGRPLTRLCMQRAVTLRKNAGIFENRVELVRHDKRSWNPSDSRSVAVGVVLWGSPGLPQGLGVGAFWVGAGAAGLGVTESNTVLAEAHRPARP